MARYDFETAEARLINTHVPESVDGVERFNLTLDGEAAADGASGIFLTISALGNAVTSDDAGGNSITATFLKQLILLKVSPGDSCFNKTEDLSGNIDDEEGCVHCQERLDASDASA